MNVTPMYGKKTKHWYFFEKMPMSEENPQFLTSYFSINYMNEIIT